MKILGQKKRTCLEKKDVWNLHDNISCFYLWLIYRHNQYAKHNTVIRSRNKGG